MATKQQEREALDKIAEIIKGLGQDSYIAAAFDGCLDMAEDNIGNDFMCSMKARAEDAQQEVASLLVENRKQADSLQALSEAVAQKQKNIDGRDEQIANLNSIIKMQADRIKELEDDFEICKRIFLYAYDCIASTCKREIKRNPWDDRGTYRKAVNAYGWGFCEGLQDAFKAQKAEHQEWGLVMVTPQAVVEEADGLGKPRAIGRNEVDMDALGARQKGYRDGLKFDPNSRLEGRPERAQLASCR